MKKRVIIGVAIGVLIVCIAILFTGADKISADAMAGTDAGSIQIEENVVGTWYLSSDTDFIELDRSFPDVFAFGCEMEILPDGRINWHVGAAGAAGIYEAKGNQLTASVSEVMEYDEYRVLFTMDDEDMLKMKYKGIPLKWTR